MQYRDYYETLGVSKSANQDEIKESIPEIGTQVPS